MDFLIREPQPDTLTEAAEPEPVVDLSRRRQCPCGKMFTPYRSFQHYHSDACRVKYTKMKPSRYVKKPFRVVVCEQCGTEFRTNDAKRRYCCNEHYLLHEAARHVEAETRTCLQCGAEFVTTHWSKRYCSVACRREARRGSADTR